MKHIATLHPTAPYNFALLPDFLSRFAHPTLDITHDAAYWRALSIGKAMALVRVTASGSVQQPVLQVDLAASRGEIETEKVVAALERVLPTHLGHTPFYEFARQDTRLWNGVEPLIGFPELRTASVFEALTQTIIEQQIAWIAAQKAQRWLVGWIGNSIEYQGRSYYTAPTAAQLAVLTVDDLKPTRITFKRMGLLIELARQVAQSELDLEGLSALTPDDAYQCLLALKGIGHWTAAVTLERAFGYDRWVAYNDVVLQAATNRYFYGGVGRIPPEQVTETFARFGEFAGLAARYTMHRWVFEQYPVVSPAASAAE